MLTIYPVNPVARDFQRKIESKKRFKQGFGDAGRTTQSAASAPAMSGPLRARTSMEDLIVLGHANSNAPAPAQRTYTDPYFERPVDQNGQYELDFHPGPKRGRLNASV